MRSWEGEKRVARESLRDLEERLQGRALQSYPSMKIKAVGYNLPIDPIHITNRKSRFAKDSSSNSSTVIRYQVII